MSEDYGFAEFAIRDKGAQLEVSALPPRVSLPLLATTRQTQTLITPDALDRTHHLPPPTACRRFCMVSDSAQPRRQFRVRAPLQHLELRGVRDARAGGRRHAGVVYRRRQGVL